MQLELDQGLDLAAVQGMRVSARLVALSHVLQLSGQELQQAISDELAENPALELVETPSCRICGGELDGSLCVTCLQRQKGDGPSVDDSLPYSERELQPRLSDEEPFDPLVRVAGEQSLAERLLADLGLLLPDSELRIAEYLVGSLDEHGYLACSLEEAAEDLEVGLERVRTALAALQSLEPIGIGARNLRECLLLQIDQLARQGLSQPYAREVVSELLTELGHHQLSRIASRLGITREQVVAVWEFVRSKLNPHPAQGFSETNAHDRDTRQMYIRPEVVVSRGPHGFEVDVVESRRFLLQVNPLYQRLQLQFQAEGGACSTDEQRHVRQYVSRAKLFITNINQRRQTLYRITCCLVERQREFLEHGVRALKPLNRAEVAAELGLHESTVSRATAGKYLMLPNGEVIPYTHFFTPSLSVKDIIKEIIEREGAPLTDQALCARLAERGIVIARRTVAKYRNQLAILRSSLR